MDVPLYVDWQRSALIINGHAVGLMPSLVPIDMGVYHTNTPGQYAEPGTARAEVRGGATLPGTIEFVPPHTTVNKTLLGVSNEYFGPLPDSLLQGAQMVLTDGSTKSVQQALFTGQNSPLSFRSYLTVVVGGQKNGKELVFQHTFFVSQVFNARISPGHFPFNLEKMGDHYYVVDYPSEKGQTGVGIVGGTPLLAADKVREPSGNGNK